MVKLELMKKINSSQQSEVQDFRLLCSVIKQRGSSCNSIDMWGKCCFHRRTFVNSFHEFAQNILHYWLQQLHLGLYSLDCCEKRSG